MALWLTKRYKLKIVQLYAPWYSEEINSFYNDVDETLGKSNHYTMVMGDFDAQTVKRTNPMETAQRAWETKEATNWYKWQH